MILNLFSLEESLASNFIFDHDEQFLFRKNENKIQILYLNSFTIPYFLFFVWQKIVGTIITGKKVMIIILRQNFFLKK